MHPNESRSGRRASSEPIEPADLMPDLEGPDFAVWADSDELAPPDLPLPSSWEPELPAEFPAVADIPVAPAPASYDASEARRSAAERSKRPSPAFSAPPRRASVQPAQIDAPLTDDGRRVRLREWAAQLWARGAARPGGGREAAPYLHPG